MITYRHAEHLSEDVLRRWLLWAMKGDPAEARIMREIRWTKPEILQALVWVGAL